MIHEIVSSGAQKHIADYSKKAVTLPPHHSSHCPTLCTGTKLTYQAVTCTKLLTAISLGLSYPSIHTAYFVWLLHSHTSVGTNREQGWDKNTWEMDGHCMVSNRERLNESLKASVATGVTKDVFHPSYCAQYKTSFYHGDPDEQYFLVFYMHYKNFNKRNVLIFLKIGSNPLPKRESKNTIQTKGLNSFTRRTCSASRNVSSQ